MCTTLCFLVAIKTKKLGSGGGRECWEALTDPAKTPGYGSLPECKKYFLWGGMGYTQISGVASLAFLQLSLVGLEPGNDFTVQADLQDFPLVPGGEVRRCNTGAQTDKYLGGWGERAVFGLSSHIGLWPLRSGLRWWSSLRDLKLEAANTALVSWGSKYSVSRMESRWRKVGVFPVPEWEEVHIKPRGTPPSLCKEPAHTLGKEDYSSSGPVATPKAAVAFGHSCHFFSFSTGFLIPHSLIHVHSFLWLHRYRFFFFLMSFYSILNLCYVPSNMATL